MSKERKATRWSKTNRSSVCGVDTYTNPTGSELFMGLAHNGEFLIAVGFNHNVWATPSASGAALTPLRKGHAYLRSRAKKRCRVWRAFQWRCSRMQRSLTPPGPE